MAEPGHQRQLSAGQQQTPTVVAGRWRVGGRTKNENIGDGEKIEIDFL
jgi:hypothetical protein